MTKKVWSAAHVGTVGEDIATDALGDVGSDMDDEMVITRCCGNTVPTTDPSLCSRQPTKLFATSLELFSRTEAVIRTLPTSLLST